MWVSLRLKALDQNKYRSTNINKLCMVIRFFVLKRYIWSYILSFLLPPFGFVSPFWDSSVIYFYSRNFWLQIKILPANWGTWIWMKDGLWKLRCQKIRMWHWNWPWMHQKNPSKNSKWLPPFKTLLSLKHFFPQTTLYSLSTPYTSLSPTNYSHIIFVYSKPNHSNCLFSLSPCVQ